MRLVDLFFRSGTYIITILVRIRQSTFIYGLCDAGIGLDNSKKKPDA